MSASKALEDVKGLLEADSNGDAAAHRKLLEAVHKLQLEVELPHETATRVRFQPVQNIAVRIALEYDILQSAAKRGKQHVTAAELSKETGVEEVIVERLMRIICWMGYCDEVGENTYKPNDTTLHVCTRGMIGAEKHHTEVVYGIGGKIVDMMRTQGFHPYGENGFKDPMEWAHGHRFFDFFAANDEHKQNFDDYMAARRVGTQLQWFDIFPAETLIDDKPLRDSNEVLVCDVGGGQGHEIAKFHERFPDKVGRLVLEDLARSFQGVKLPAKIEMVAHDFFQPQPVKGARIYYMRQIIHDWPDDECREILAQITQAMNKDSRLLIDDYVMPATGADFRTIHMDITMMLYQRSEERTERRFRNLLESAGLEVVHIWTPPTSFESIIETRLM